MMNLSKQNICKTAFRTKEKKNHLNGYQQIKKLELQKPQTSVTQTMALFYPR